MAFTKSALLAVIAATSVLLSADAFVAPSTSLKTQTVGFSFWQLFHHKFILGKLFRRTQYKNYVGLHIRGTLFANRQYVTDTCAAARGEDCKLDKLIIIRVPSWAMATIE